MAIQFARCEYISRSSGGNACRKASYNQRDVLRCERTGELFSFKERGGNVHHEILLPEGADSRFKNSSALWNEAENCEKRKDSQVAKEFVLALPDDKQVILEDRVELTRRFSQIFVEKGVAVQMDVHSPHDGEKNWHAHLLVTTRRFSEDGLTFFSKKATDLDPVIRGKTVVEANLWGEVWRDLQNDYFQEKGYDLRVDPIGIIPQEHLGPVRMRHHLNEAVLRAELLQKANEKFAQNPQAVLEEVTRTRAVFTPKDVELFLRKHVPETEREGLLERVLEHPNALPLYNKETKEQSGYFTTRLVRAEEEKLLRFADSIDQRSAYGLSSFAVAKGLENRTLTDEQRKAYDLCVSSGQNPNIIQGRAGVGKSYVLGAIREAHVASGFRVLGLAPTNKVAMDLINDGFIEAKTCHSFLFRFKNGREKLDSNTVVIVDEAGMLGTTLSVELFNAIKNSGAKLILVGDDRQLSSVERGGTFKFLSERYGAAELREVRRQTIGWQKAVSEALAEGDLSKGNVKTAVHLLEENKAIAWGSTKEEALSKLLKDWAKDTLLNPTETRQIITQKNVDVDALNQGARDILRAQGRLGETEIVCSTQRGRVAFAIGDRIQFTKKDNEQGLMNGSFGIIDHIDLKTKKLTVLLDNKETKIVNPDTYDGLRHGYAATVYKSQGATLNHVYVLHSNTASQSTTYVALSRQTKSLGLYVAQNDTPSHASLIYQMSRCDGNGTSLIFDTQRDIEKSQEKNTFSAQLKHGAEALMTKVKDAFHKNEKFYQVEKPVKGNQEKAEIVEFKASNGGKEIGLSPQKDQEGFSQPAQSPEISPLKRQTGPNKEIHHAVDAKALEDALRQNMTSFADDVFSSIGEAYNAAASSATERRYGKNGHIAVNLKTGAWIDYKDDSLSGGPLHMLTKLKGLSFKEALEYGANWVGLSQRDLSQGGFSQTSLSQQKNQGIANKLDPEQREEVDPERKQKIENAQALWDKGQPLQGTLAERYLREHRKIEGPLPDDLRYLPFFMESQSKKSFPCLIAGARSASGEITAVQITFLDPVTAAKADVEVLKKSFGVIKGSAVTLQENKGSKTLFIAEGVETALSLKSAGIQGTIKASLGLSNIKRIVPENLNTPIVVCADHDAPDSPAAKSLEKSVMVLQEKGYRITVIKPTGLHQDFNDVLKAKGSQGVREILERDLPKDLFKIVYPKKEVSLEGSALEKSSFDTKQVTQKSPLTLSQKHEERTIALAGESLSKVPPGKLLEKHSLNQEHSTEKSVRKEVNAVFEELTQQCAQKLYAYLGEEKITLTLDLKNRVEKQAEQAANFIFFAHTLKGTQPTEKETKHFLLRAKYELDRIPTILDELTHKWQKAGNYKGQKDELIAHMIAERQASIEGRMYLEAKQKGLIPLSIIPDLAAKELNAHRAKTEPLARELIQTHSLSESAATYCAKDILRHQETHGEKPSSAQVSTMVQISRDLDQKGYDPSLGSHTIEYLRRRDGDLMFRDMSSQDKDLSGLRDFLYISQEQSYGLSQGVNTSSPREKLSHQTLEETSHRKGYEMEI
jgi:Ti-type conjugative transfer relaxase TraA